MKEEYNHYLETIGGFLEEENKIVSYKWLSCEFGIHVNTSKHLLNVFLSSHPDVSATFLLMGQLPNGENCVSVVNSKDVESVKEQFKIITSQHVYSLQKSPIADLQILHAVSKLKNERPTGPIKYSKDLFRSSAKKAVSEEKKPGVEEKAEKRVSPTKKVDQKNVETTEKLSPKEKSNQKSPAKPTDGSPLAREGKNVKSNAATKKETNQINALFAKASPKGSNKKTAVSPPETKPIKEETNEVKKKKEKVIQAEPKQQSKRRKEEKDEDIKKRKRIKVYSDSEESEEERERVPTPEPEDVLVVAEPDPEPVANNKRKRRKVVDKMVMDEDGYMQTKKEVVFETDSEPELEEPPKEEKKPIKPAPASSPVKEGKKVAAKGGKDGTKQTSLLSFFKKN